MVALRKGLDWLAFLLFGVGSVAAEAENAGILDRSGQGR